ncbi:HTH-type transcriptional regulator AlsR [Hyella patelloides LEGE 07179]|uniref:HTH-type transcriptional regulator AlsR n=1 Tax=Hyella patelloides LEGE 07179 TaxID=945734 RepID=A0A563W323_9CYAN|nr:LysR family transcriptional regulator [Hyella patelloides]VEP18045.1 HTH-type transcriptional regulator AlsR [Hyella patelloides LEGE 07179]
MELRHLRYFVAVAEELHFGRAAKRLCIAQQPLSRQIRNLEDEIGVQLFYRTKRTVRLTEVGQIFLKEARKTLEQAKSAINLAQQANQGKIGGITIGFTGSALNIVLPMAVRQFKQLYPQVDLTLKRLQTIEQVAALRSGEIHLGILHPPIDDNTLFLETITHENLVVALPDTHFLAQDTSIAISIKQLANEPFILFPRQIGSVLYDQIISLCRQAGFSPNVIQEAIPQQTILGLVAAGMGISLIHSSVRSLGRHGVVFQNLIEPTPELNTAVAWSPDATNPVLPLFLSLVREITF